MGKLLQVTMAAAGIRPIVLATMLVVGGAPGMLAAASGSAGAPTFATAIEELMDGRLETARSQLEELVRAEPEGLTARRLLAVVELRRHAAGNAIVHLESVLARWEQDPLAWALLATAYLELGDFHAATELLRKLRESGIELNMLTGLEFVARGADGAAEVDLLPLGTAIGLERELLPVEGLGGLLELAAGEYDRALDAGTRLAAQGEDRALGYNLVAAAHLAKGDRTQARAAMEQALALRPDLMAVEVNLARLDMDDGDFDSAELRFARVLTVVPSYLDALMGLVDLTDILERDADSLYWLEQAWRFHPAVREVGLMLVKRYLEHNRVPDALTASRQLHALFPADGPVVRARGLALLAEGANDAAIEMLLRLVRIEPGSPENWHLLAAGLLRQQDYSAANRALEEALTLQSDYLPSLIVRVQLQVLDSNLQGALGTARRIQRTHPGLSVGHQLEGEVQARRGEYARAAAAFERALVYDPQPRLALLRAAAQRQGGDVEGALGGLRAWLLIRPRDADVRARLAQYLEQLQRVPEALREYRRVVRQSPDNVLAHNNLAWIYLFRGDSRALHHAERAYALAPERPEIMDTFGWTLVSFDQVEQGLALLEEASRRAPQLADIRYHLAVAYERSGRPLDARRELERLLSPGDYEAFSYGDQAEAMWERLNEPGLAPVAPTDSPSG